MKLKVLFIKKIGKINNIKLSSKENSCAIPRNTPNNVYFELLLHPAKTIPNILKADIEKKKKKFKYSS